MQIFTPVKSNTAFEKYEALINEAIDAVHKREHQTLGPSAAITQAKQQNPTKSTT